MLCVQGGAPLSLWRTVRASNNRQQEGRTSCIPLLGAVSNVSICRWCSISIYRRLSSTRWSLQACSKAPLGSYPLYSVLCDQWACSQLGAIAWAVLVARCVHSTWIRRQHQSTEARRGAADACVVPLSMCVQVALRYMPTSSLFDRQMFPVDASRGYTVDWCHTAHICTTHVDWFVIGRNGQYF